MGKYKISDLANLSGVKPHTIRIWEQRYNMLTPLRSDTNIRYYDDDQLRRLLNVVTLQNAGFKISAIGNLSDEEITNQIELLNNSGGPGIKEESIINQLISAGFTFNEHQFEKAFSNAILSFGLSGAYEKVLYPMMNKIGLLWVTEEISPAQEHFISQLIRQKLFAAIDSLEPVSEFSETWLLFLPENEHHEIGLLVANYILRSKGINVCYLGADVPLQSLKETVNTINPKGLLMFNVKPNQEEYIQNWIESIGNHAKELVLCCSAKTKYKLNIKSNSTVIDNYTHFIEFVTSR